jgi:hypothetical protein
MTAPRTTAQSAADEAYAAFVAGCTCGLTDHQHTTECAARWDAAAEAAELANTEAPAAPFEIGQRVRFTAEIGSPELVHVTGEITEAGPRESVVRLDTRVPGYVAELRSFNIYIEPIPELTAVEAVRLVTRRAQRAALDHAEPLGPVPCAHVFMRTMGALSCQKCHVGASATLGGAFRTYAQQWAEADRRTELAATDPTLSAYAMRLVQAAEYRAELRAYGVPVAQLVYPFAIGPDPEYLGHPDRAEYRAAWEQAGRLTGAAEYAAALRALADIVEATPEVHRYNDFFVWYGESREDLAALARAALAAGATVAKDVEADSYNLELRLGPLKLMALANRSAVCERVVLGTDEVTEMVPDPEYVAPELPAAPLVQVTRTVDRVEWRCTPLLAES